MDRIFIIKAENAGNLTVSLTFNDNTVQTVDIHHRKWQHRLGQELGLDFSRRATARWGGTVIF